MARACDKFYPTLRVFTYDAHQTYSAPMSVFGPLIGVIYVGSLTLAFRQAERVRSLSRHFDKLVRVADGDPRDVPKWLDALARDESGSRDGGRPAAATAPGTHRDATA